MGRTVNAKRFALGRAEQLLKNRWITVPCALATRVDASGP
jgi:hypothetical protein